MNSHINNCTMKHLLPHPKRGGLGAAKPIESKKPTSLLLGSQNFTKPSHYGAC